MDSVKNATDSTHLISKGTKPPVKRLFVANIQFAEKDTCRIHKKESVFYCRDSECQRGICARCVVQEHKRHDFVEMIDQKERLVECLATKVETYMKQLEKNRNELQEAKLEISIRNGLCVTELKASKKEILRKISEVFDANINHIVQFKNIVNEEIEDKIADLNDKLDVMHQTKTVMNTSLTENYLSVLLAAIPVSEGIKKDFSQYYSYNGYKAGKKAEKLFKYIIPWKKNTAEEESDPAREQPRKVPKNPVQKRKIAENSAHEGMW